jgi:tetratricopeptide (TPR) repeat protein
VAAEMIPFVQRPPHKHAAIYRVKTAHMALPNAAGFRSYVDNLRTRILVQAIVSADPDDRIITAFRRAEALFPLPLEVDSLSERTTQQTLDINRRILRGGVNGKTDGALAHELYEMAGDAKDLSAEATQLYALSLAFDPKGPHAPFAANNLAHNLLQNDLWYAARSYLDRAQELINLVPAKEKKFLMNLHDNTGVAHEKTGDFCGALDYYKRAGSKGEHNRRTLANALKENKIDCPYSSLNTSLNTRAKAFAGGRPRR